MSEDQIYEIGKMALTVLISIFGGYQWAKNTIKINISQTQYSELKNSISVSTKEINSQITELNNTIKMSIKSSSQSSADSPVKITNINVNTAQPSVGSTGSGSEYNLLLEALRRKSNE